MFAVPSERESVNSNGCVMPGMPAEPRNSAYSDHRNAARVPIEMSVSIVAAPWRRLVQAALWNGHAPHTITGAASASDAHCQYVNCSAGIIAIAMTGTVRMIEMIRRWRSEASSGSASVASVVFAFLGAGTAAVYPAFSTSAMSCAASYPAGTVTFAFSVA